jgi:N-acetylmuramoyl-L-alanine amidase
MGATATTAAIPGAAMPRASSPPGVALADPVSTTVPVADTDATQLVAATAGADLRGKVVVIDPGHNGANGRHPRQIARKVDIGNGRKACDTTGTQTNAGYAESAYTFDVATRLAALLRARGATVVLTRADDRGVGPCITERAAVGNRTHADVAISIHADGAAAAGYGFHVIVPKGIGRNDGIVTPSRRLGITVRDAFRSGTGEPLSTYTGTRTGGLVTRSDLGGLNLSTVPKVFIECGNMRNAVDARRMASRSWRQQAAQALATGLTRYLIRTAQ